MSSDPTTLSDKSLRRAEREAISTLASLRDDPGRGLPPDAAREARDRAIVAAHETRERLDAVRAEKESRAEGSAAKAWWGRFVQSEDYRSRRTAEQNARIDSARAERVAFHAMLAEENGKRSAEALERRRAAGLVWEPTGPAGGAEAGAVFSSSVLWDSMKEEIRDNELVEPALHLRDLSHLWWALNAITEGGGSVTVPSGPGRLPPSWPSYDRIAADGVRFREESLAHLAKAGYLTLERNGATLTIGFGPKAVALTKSWQES